MDALQSFNKTVQRHRLFDKSHKLLIAVSGGSDSTALCHICQELGYQIGMAHINYQLRGKESDADAKFVQSLAATLHSDLYLKSIDCNTYSKDHGLSIQVSARNIRYKFFDSILAMHGYDYLLTAHHAKDNVETILYTLTKGATLKGLRGIPLSRGKIRRPLLHTTKSAIEVYLNSRNIGYRHDASNNDSKYQRNYIRHKILPLLEEINPTLESTLINTSMLGAGFQLLLDDMLEEQKNQFRETKKIGLDQMSNKPSRFAWLYELINPYGFNFNDSLDIWSTQDQKQSTGKSFHAGNYQLTIDRGQLLLDDISELGDYHYITIESVDSASYDSKGRVLIKKMDTIPADQGAYFDGSKIQFPLLLRRWLPGDRFRPAGMNGKSKKVKDYLTDKKISGPDRSKVEVLLSQGEIIWVVGYRMAHGYKADQNDQPILFISVD